MDRTRYEYGLLAELMQRPGAVLSRAQLIDKLLALAAVEHRQRIDHPERIDLNVLACEAAEQCASRLEQAGIVQHIESPVWSAFASGDAFLLRQALLNMIDNAADFSLANGKITLRIDCPGEEVRIEVADHGSGVPDYALPRVFERFYSLPRPARGRSSSGLGLCFVAEVAALHGGAATLLNRQAASDLLPAAGEPE